MTEDEERRVAGLEKAVLYLLDRQPAIDGRMKADLFAMRRLIDVLSASGHLDRERYDAVLGEAVRMARETQIADPVAHSLWSGFGERLAELLGEAAPPRPAQS